MCFFFFNDTATTEIYTLSLHDALPICARGCRVIGEARFDVAAGATKRVRVKVDKTARNIFARQTSVRVSMTVTTDRNSTRLNSSHANISYAVFCLKKKKKNNNNSYAQK